MGNRQKYHLQDSFVCMDEGLSLEIQNFRGMRPQWDFTNLYDLIMTSFNGIP